MIKTYKEVRMTNDGEDRNGLRVGIIEKASGCQSSSLARKSLKFCQNDAAVWTFFMKLLSII